MIAEGRQAEIFAWQPGTVLKLFRGPQFASEAQQEASAMSAVHASGGPAAAAMLDTLPDGDRLLHGDLHPGNIITSASGPVVIDWPAAMRGDPAADVARSMLLLRLGEAPPGVPALVRIAGVLGRRTMLKRYLRTYRRAHRLNELVALIDDLMGTDP